MNIPIKLIVTNDPEVTNLIIKGTNRQTQVQIEAFESLSPFHKELEEFYSTVGKDKAYRLYYERRSKQYDQLPIKKSQIISLTAQLKSFLAMFLNEPHSTHRYYGELLNANRNRIFHVSHSPYPYYASGYAFYALEKLFTAGELDQKYRHFKFQLLLLFRLLTEKIELPYLNNKKGMDKYCSSLIDILSEPKEAREYFGRTVEILAESLKKDRYDADPTRLRAFTADLLERSRIGKSGVRIGIGNATVERQRGIVKWFSEIKGWGFIHCEDRDCDVFAHFSDIQGPGYRNLVQGQTVEFTIIQAEKGLQATNIAVLGSAVSV